MNYPESVHTECSNAIEAGDIAVVETLIQRYPDLVNHPDWTPPPLHCAILWNQLKIAEVLLDNGADIEMRDPDQQTTPLRYAIMFCKTELIPMLLSRGANTGTINGLTAMQLAQKAASGAYEEHEDLPRRDAYKKVIETLQSHQ